MHQTYLSLQYSIPEEFYEQAYAALLDMQYLGIAEGHDELILYFSHPGESSSSLLLEQRIALKFLQFNVPFTQQNTSTIVEESWNKAWEDSIEPVWVNERIVITPSWKQDTVHAPITIIINPQMSFGTGHHETTRMTANLLEHCVQKGSTWIDAGTGTGVLAILAVKCGAETVIAFDNDTWSVQNTLENFTLNKIPLDKNITVVQADVNHVLLKQCNGITANLHRNLLAANVPRFYEALSPMNGDLLVSGLLKYDHDDIVQRAEDCGFSYKRTVSEGAWIALHFIA